MRFGWKPPSAKRVPIMVHPEARDALVHLLTNEYAGTGIGYSQFLMGAVKQAGHEWHARRQAGV